jgi:hypothetical protein
MDRVGRQSLAPGGPGYPVQSTRAVARSGPLFESPLWIPHVTLAEGLSEEERATARDALLPSFTPIEATADRLELVRFPPTHVEWGAALSDASLKAII